MISWDHRRKSSFEESFQPATPVSIPRRGCRSTVPSDNISALLEQTRIPARHVRGRRKVSLESSSPVIDRTRRQRPTPKRRDSLFDFDVVEISAQSLPDSYSYLLTPPDSMPDLSRSYSTTSMESSISTASSYHYSKSPRRLTPPREQVNLEHENPLFPEDDDFAFESPCPSPEHTTNRRSSLGLLLGPLKVVAPNMSASSMVSALTANLSSWAASLSSTQHDDRYGLLPNASHMRLPPSRSFALPQSMPRPVKASGPQSSHSTIIEAEMERPLLAEETKPIYVELLPWSKPVRNQTGVEVLVRAREPRMNPDFLRILVLETNMRRLGKISAGTGRARMILSPRCGENRPSQLRQSSFPFSCS